MKKLLYIVLFIFPFQLAIAQTTVELAQIALAVEIANQLNSDGDLSNDVAVPTTAAAAAAVIASAPAATVTAAVSTVAAGAPSADVATAVAAAAGFCGRGVGRVGSKTIKDGEGRLRDDQGQSKTIRDEADEKGGRGGQGGRGRRRRATHYVAPSGFSPAISC